MDLILRRKQFRRDGIFSELTDTSGKVIAKTLEHAYYDVKGNCFLPKIINGKFVCKRGPHRLHNMTQDFITFEVTGVEGHSNLLFHVGNYNRDSEGCCLLGENVSTVGGLQMITNSRATFKKFMDMQAGVDTFNLTVTV